MVLFGRALSREETERQILAAYGTRLADTGVVINGIGLDVTSVSAFAIDGCSTCG